MTYESLLVLVCNKFSNVNSKTLEEIVDFIYDKLYDAAFDDGYDTGVADTKEYYDDTIPADDDDTDEYDTVKPSEDEDAYDAVKAKKDTSLDRFLKHFDSQREYEQLSEDLYKLALKIVKDYESKQ